MEYRVLGRTGMRVSRLCFGSSSFGREIEEEAVAAMFRRCRDVGINFFDTSNVYYSGRSEEVLGKLIADCREELVISSKVGFRVGADVNAGGLSRRHIMAAVEGTLRRLGTDRLDIYFVHTFDPDTPIEVTLRAMDDLVRQGKILCPAASNWAAWQIATALGISAGEGLARFECIQPMYNLVKRQAEVEILPLAQAQGLGVITYAPLGAGLLTGKYGVARRPENGRLLWDPVYKARYANPVYFETADRFTEHAEEHGLHPASLAVAWVMSHPVITAPIIGARNVQQLEASLGALDIEMTRQWRDEISALSIEPPPATDRSEEREGVIYGGVAAK
jgi:aryl-alcohol dehydrogenase-like predicted oxidoreductase